MSVIEIRRGQAPLIVSLPHTGTEIPPQIEARLVSPWRARKDADWHVHWLYAFAADLGATIIRTPWSRTVIDVNRDPSGASLYPGQTTTGLCPLETFDGEPLYRDGQAPDDAEIAERRDLYFDPYHQALQAEIDRLRQGHGRVVLYDAHSICSVVPRLFDGELPELNLGTNSGASCDPGLTEAVASLCAASGRSFVLNGRFKGGWITRHYGRPEQGVQALQMELAWRGYLREPATPLTPENWPVDFDPAFAAPLQATLFDILSAALKFTPLPPSTGKGFEKRNSNRESDPAHDPS